MAPSTLPAAQPASTRPSAWTRRALLRLALAGGAALAVGGCIPAPAPAPPATPHPTSPPALKPTLAPAPPTLFPTPPPLPTAPPPTATARPTLAPSPTATPLPARPLELFVWWRDAGAAEGFASLVRRFQREQPGARVVNLAERDPNDPDPKVVLKVRLLTGRPPDVFQGRIGQGLLDPWLQLDKLEPLDDLYGQARLWRWLPKGMQEIASAHDHVWCLPVSVQRANVLWYNARLFAEAELEPPTTFDELVSVSAALKKKGVIPLALGDQDASGTAHLFEVLLLGTLGADGYRGLWTHQTSWANPGVIQALKQLKQLLALANEDHATLTADQAADLVSTGQAVMTIAGDWMAARFHAAHVKDYAWSPAPDTKGIFDVVSDGFALPRGAPHRETALEWLALLASVQGQDAFNAPHGSIPARTDAGQTAYDDDAKSAMRDYANDELVPSVVYGLAAREQWAQRFVEAIHDFSAKQDVAAAQDALGQACLDVGSCA